ncbi:MAG: ABC transporter permease [Clostridia bacterium]|jgi:hypothetical protein|nr:ABC transporter permease [Clostridia bacterium]MDD4502956.1 DUF1566 domain-containing protein [Clostridia bacterium]
MIKEKGSNILGWIGVGITTIFSSIWAYWGSIENFHEGWYSVSIWENLFMLFFQYLLFAIVFVVLGVITLKWKIAGLILHILLAGFSIWFFSGANFIVIGLMIVIPIIGLGLLYYFGNPKPKKWAYRSLIFIPLIIIIAVFIPMAIKVSKRVNDNDFGTRIIEGNEVTLVWAPRGPGWPDSGTTWDEAIDICRYLSEDGTTVMDEIQDIWRLPTVDEAVRSMMLHGENVNGVWYPDEKKAVYDKTPDKESPLWDVHSQVIYYWTSESEKDNADRAYIIVYHGGIHSKMKIDGQSYLSFRAVKNVLDD